MAEGQLEMRGKVEAALSQVQSEVCPEAVQAATAGRLERPARV